MTTTLSGEDCRSESEARSRRLTRDYRVSLRVGAAKDVCVCEVTGKLKRSGWCQFWGTVCGLIYKDRHVNLYKLYSFSCKYGSVCARKRPSGSSNFGAVLHVRCGLNNSGRLLFRLWSRKKNAEDLGSIRLGGEPLRMSLRSVHHHHRWHMAI